MNGDHSSQRPASAASRMYDRSKGDQGGGMRQSNSSRLPNPKPGSPLKFGRGKRLGHTTSRNFPCSTALLLVLCLLVVLITIYSSEVISSAFRGEQGSSQLDGFLNNLDHMGHLKPNIRRRNKLLSPALIQGVDHNNDPKDLSSAGGRDQVDKVQDIAGKFSIGLIPGKELRRTDQMKRERSAGLYNEQGRSELVEYEAKLEKQDSQDTSKQEEIAENQGVTDALDHKVEADNDEYDDDGGEEELEEHQGKSTDQQDDGEEVQINDAESMHDGNSHVLEWDSDTKSTGAILTQDKESMIGAGLGENASSYQDQQWRQVEIEQKIVQKPPKPKRKSRHKATAPCSIDFKTTTEGLEEPVGDKKFANFSLSYIQMEERPVETMDWEPRFAGHQTLEEREETFHVKDQTVHCGFVQAPEVYPPTGFELSDADTEFLQTCHIAVSSCIFGNWDHLRAPTNKKMSDYSKKNICFVMFVDQPSLDAILQEEEIKPSVNGSLGLWRIVLIKNLPYLDGRRNGKVPKFLTHRLFPNARYSIWLDSKLRLDSDPLLILEYFLWRGKHEYAISNHYDRHCVWEEVEQNKCLNKFNHTIIDQQFQFYQEDGLTQFNESDPHRLLPSYVPEGSFIVRAHTPMANLFSCLWFNEVDHFTPRDQLSFAYTYLKLVRTNPSLQFHLNMFKVIKLNMQG
jgi:hypothetical protein